MSFIARYVNTYEANYNYTPKMLLSYRNDNDRVTLEQQECETDIHTEKDIYTFIKIKKIMICKHFKII